MCHCKAHQSVNLNFRLCKGPGALTAVKIEEGSAFLVCPVTSVPLASAMGSRAKQGQDFTLLLLSHGELSTRDRARSAILVRWPRDCRTLAGTVKALFLLYS